MRRQGGPVAEADAVVTDHGAQLALIQADAHVDAERDLVVVDCVLAGFLYAEHELISQATLQAEAIEVAS